MSDFFFKKSFGYGSQTHSANVLLMSMISSGKGRLLPWGGDILSQPSCANPFRYFCPVPFIHSLSFSLFVSPYQASGPGRHKLQRWLKLLLPLPWESQEKRSPWRTCLISFLKVHDRKIRIVFANFVVWTVYRIRWKNIRVTIFFSSLFGRNCFHAVSSPAANSAYD